MSTDQRQCLWCGASPLSREHIIPRWLVEVLVALSPSEVGYEMGWAYATPDGEDPGRTYGVPEPEVVKRSVCKSCNSGWMSTLEDEVRDRLTALVLGQETRLRIPDLVVIARWSAKTAVLTGGLQRGAVALSPGDLDTIRLGDTAPRGFRVRLALRTDATSSPSDLLLTGAWAASEGTTDPDPEPVTPNCFVVTLGLGHLAVSVCGGPGMANPDLWRNGPTEPLMAWPPSPVGVQWPPLAPVVDSREELREFHEGWFERILNPDFPRPTAIDETLLHGRLTRSAEQR